MGFEPVGWVKDKAKDIEKAVQNVGKEIEKGAQNIGKEASKGAQAVGEFAEKGVQDLGKNVERSMQDNLGALALMFDGDFDNFGRTMLDYGLFMTTGGLANPDDVSRLTGTESNVQRKVREGQEAVEAATAADLAAQASERQRQAAATISGIVSGYNRTPGRSASLLGDSTAKNTLLTMRG